MHGRNRKRIGLAVTLVFAVALLASCGKKATVPDLTQSAAPDKELYASATESIKSGRHVEGRLVMQTLINAYPDSEYLAKAKLAIADSFYKEGGTAGLLQAVNEYNDFKTFFPFLEEAAYAQKQIGMAHYRRMEKPDRDRSAARMAEDEFQKFLLQYPEHELAPEVKQRLRDVQEVLAEGDFRIARFYFIKKSDRASAARLLELAARYELYSQADKALWMLAQIYERNETLVRFAGPVYSRLVSEYPLSDLVPTAKERLVELGQPVPQPNPVALARMQEEQNAARDTPGMVGKVWNVFSSRPPVYTAARAGNPQMEPPSDRLPHDFFQPPPASGPVTEAQSTGGGTGSATGTGVGVQIVTPTTPPAGANPAVRPPTTTPAPNSSASGTGTAPPAGSTGAAPIPQTNEGKKKKEDEKKKKEEEKKKEGKESSSKKKGIKKIIPW